MPSLLSARTQTVPGKQVGHSCCRTVRHSRADQMSVCFPTFFSLLGRSFQAL